MCNLFTNADNKAAQVSGMDNNRLKVYKNKLKTAQKKLRN